MTAEVSPSAGFSSVEASALARKRLSIGFMNWAHALDHFVILIYPTVVIGLQAIYGQSYATLIALSTASFVAFGLFSLPAGWLGDRWSRRDMMVAFFVGCGLSLIAAAFAPSLFVLGFALFALGMFAAIYHPVGTAMILENATQRGRTMAFNGVCGNLGVSLAAGITAALTAALSWRGAFLVPGVICVATGIVYYLAGAERRRARGQAQRAGRRRAVGAGGGDDLRPVHRGLAQRRPRLQHHLDLAAEDRRRARRQRHFAAHGRRPDHGGVPVRRGGADHRRPPGRALSAAHPVCHRRRHAVHRRAVGGLRQRHRPVVRARLHHGGDLRPDHAQRLWSSPATPPTPGAAASMRCAISSPSWCRASRCR